jgi:pimeloyl-ACP methyl ester carboxylesterase
MIRKQFAAGVGLALLFAGSGCISCGHESCHLAIEAGPHCGVPQSDRRHVYTILINGLDPTGGLDALRLKIAERGFEKIYRVELCHTGWLWREMKRVQKCDPAARFVLVGYGFGCTAAVGLAKDAAREGLPVDAVVCLDPAGVKDLAGCAERVVVIRSGPAAAEEGDCLHVACGHFSLPTQVETVDAIAVVLAETAGRIEHPVSEEIPMFWHPDAPPIRDYTLPEDASIEWRFLHDRLGPHATPLAAK